MTDRHAGYVVTLADDIREDDAEGTLNAIRMIKGVQSVEPIVAGVETMIAQSRVKSKMMQRLYEALEELSKP